MVARLTDEEVPPLSPMVINVFQKIVAPWDYCWAAMNVWRSGLERATDALRGLDLRGVGRRAWDRRPSGLRPPWLFQNTKLFISSAGDWLLCQMLIGGCGIAWYFSQWQRELSLMNNS
jgi:hypothetical protein